MCHLDVGETREGESAAGNSVSVLEKWVLKQLWIFRIGMHRKIYIFDNMTSSPCICPQPSTTTAKNQQLEHTRPPTSHKNCEIIIAVYKNNCHCGLAENYIIFRTCATSKTIPNKYSGTAKACNSSRISALQWHIINWVTKTWQVISWVRWSNCTLP